MVRAPGRIQDNASLLLESMSTHFIPASHPCPQGLFYSCSSGLPPKCQFRKYSRFSPQTRSQFVETWVITPELPGVLAPDQRCSISSGCHRPLYGKPHPTLGAWPHQHSCKGKPDCGGREVRSTCSSKGLSGALCFRSRGYRDVRKVRLAAPLEWLQCEPKGTDSDIFIPSHSQVY